jgi:primary-amine oxidase
MHPLTSPDDNSEAETIVKADPRIAELLAERYGIIDVANQLICDT